MYNYPSLKHNEHARGQFQTINKVTEMLHDMPLNKDMTLLQFTDSH